MSGRKGVDVNGAGLRGRCSGGSRRGCGASGEVCLGDGARGMASESAIDDHQRHGGVTAEYGSHGSISRFRINGAALRAGSGQ